MKRIITAVFAAAILISAQAARADVIRLIEGTILTGKIISEDDTSIIFANAHGTFRVRKVNILEMRRTDAPREDVATVRQMGGTIAEQVAARHYQEGMSREAARRRILDEQAIPKEDVQPPKKDDEAPWRGGRLSFSGGLLLHADAWTNHRSWSGHAAFDQGFDFLGSARHPLLPGLRIEGSFIRILQPAYSAEGFTLNGGPMWAFPSMKNRWGCFILALLPGASTMRRSTYYFCGQALFGYQISFGAVSLFLQTRYQYLPWRGIRAHLIGEELGIGFNLW